MQRYRHSESPTVCFLQAKLPSNVHCQ